ncbi:acetamidase/formamidase family protein [Metaplanococcus flavidus]|uniref:Acetamidase/formamidase family protein n=1 Tax=Metaplanococcus flavidus TaxID=569883 RepID=A0ABW3L900_9BACL
MIHKIELDSKNFHSSFNREYQPILTVNSGDSIQLRTLDIQWGYSASENEERTIFESREQEEELGHPLVGPIAIEGAKPGMVLEIRTNELVLAWYGRNWAAGTQAWQNEKLGLVDNERIQLDWKLDPLKMTGSCQIGEKEFRVGLSPFLALMGVAPAEPGTHRTTPPRYCGGNIDCKELVRGSSLFLPVAVEGAMFSLGDGHALQGDGENSGTAIECPMDLVNVTLILHEDKTLTMPQANTPAGWITFGFNEDLNEAAAVALDEMVQLMQQFYDVTKAEATALSSVAVDLHVTQVVNGVKGVHAILPHGVLR